jgi:D-alanyl-D-alanine carboxypeptidase/D-alanyl-D-alanine-endopeptidase (penicillin-binding protein 4)
VITYLGSTNKKIYTTDIKWQEEALGYGWSWDDYNEDYMAERSPLPVYGNLIRWIQEKNYEDHVFSYSVPEVNWQVDFDTSKSAHFLVKRNRDQNIYTITEGTEKFKKQDIPFITNKINTSLELLTDTIHKSVNRITTEMFSSNKTSQLTKINTQPTDSLLKPMMHNSDNFFAEQTLLMVSNEKLGVMNDEKIIDTLLKSDFKDLPQKPKWVDGSGLSRYNLFTPQDFIAIFNKIKNEFGMERIKVILPTGSTGTLENYYKTESNFIFAKTGTLSGVVALSGYLYTKKNKLLIFSILVNNHQSSATAVRKTIEKFIKGIREKF